MLIRSVENFFGPEGERIERLTLIDAETGLRATDKQISEMKEPEPSVVLLGVILVPIGISAPGPDGRPVMVDIRPQEVRFPIETTSLKEAFENFAKLSEEVINDLKKRQEEKNKANSGLIVPNAVQSEAINNLKLVQP